ncbi:MAG: molecular chaperone DnaK, partial [Pseudonocardiaceae bacterium]
AQEALKGTDTAAIRAAMEKLATESQALGQALYKDAGAAGGGPGGGTGDGAAAGGPAGSAPNADDVVDAEIVDDEPGSARK